MALKGRLTGTTDPSWVTTPNPSFDADSRNTKANVCSSLTHSLKSRNGVPGHDSQREEVPEQLEGGKKRAAKRRTKKARQGKTQYTSAACL
jgi:hypothetical protein